MKKRSILFILSMGIALGLFLGVNTDFEKGSFLKLMKEVETSIKDSLGLYQQDVMHEGEEGIYKIKDYTPKGDTTLCQGNICFPPSKQNG